MFKNTSQKALMIGAIISLLMAVVGIAGLIFASLIGGSDSEAVQALRGAAGFLTGLCMFYAGVMIWLWFRRRHPEAVGESA